MTGLGFGGREKEGGGAGQVDVAVAVADGAGRGSIDERVNQSTAPSTASSQEADPAS